MTGFHGRLAETRVQAPATMRAAMLNSPVRIHANSPLSDRGMCGIGAARHSRPRRRTCHVHARCAHGPGQPWWLQRRPYENFLITSRRGLVRDSELNYEFSRWKYEPFAMAGLDLLCGYPPRSVQPFPFALRVRSAAMVIRRRKVGHCAWLGAGQAAAWRSPSRSAARR